MNVVKLMNRWAVIFVSRLFGLLGWPGCIGLILIGTSVVPVWLASSLKERAMALSIDQLTPASLPLVLVANASTKPLAPALPSKADIVSILRPIQHQALASELAWSQADYRVNAISDDSLATLSINTTLKGPYPKVRKLLRTLLDKNEFLALRELTLIRANADTPEVEAHMQWVMFLNDGWPAAAKGPHD